MSPGPIGANVRDAVQRLPRRSRRRSRADPLVGAPRRTAVAGGHLPRARRIRAWFAGGLARRSACRSFAGRGQRRSNGNGSGCPTSHRRRSDEEASSWSSEGKQERDGRGGRRTVAPGRRNLVTLAGRRRRPAPSAAVPAGANIGARSSIVALASAPTARRTPPSSAAGADAWTADKCGSTKSTPKRALESLPS